MSGNNVERRHFLRGAVGIATVGIASGSVLAGCSDPGPEQNQQNNSAVRLPDYQAFSGVKPDLPGSVDGVMPGFLAFPADPVASVPERPLSGGEVSVLATASDGIVLPENRNQVWQEMNKKLGTSVKFTAISGKDYVNKVQTTIAGGDLPDFVQLPTVPRLPDILSRQFQDLTEFLVGDEIRQYPNLAAIPTEAWKNCVFNGAIYTIPSPRGIVGNLMLTRRDILTGKGLSTSISSGQDFLDMCRGLTDPKSNKYALAQKPNALLPWILEMLGGVNLWKEEGGKFTSAFETQEMKKAIDILAQMWKSGVFYPDAYGAINAQTLFTAGTSALIYGNYGVWHFQLGQGADIPGFDLAALVPPKYDGGGQARKFLNKSAVTIAGIKKSTPERTKELLRVANFWAAPFGTQEYLLMRYGLPGRDHELNGTDPVLTDVGPTEVLLPYTYIVTGEPVLYEPANPAATRAQHEVQKATVPGGVRDATIGLYSDTQLSKGATLNKKLDDLMGDIIQGRKPLSDWDAAIDVWRSEGGDTVRSEYEKSFDEANK